MLIEAVPQGVTAQTKQFACACFITAGALYGLTEKILLEFLQVDAARRQSESWFEINRPCARLEFIR